MLKTAFSKFHKRKEAQKRPPFADFCMNSIIRYIHLSNIPVPQNGGDVILANLITTNFTNEDGQ